MTWEEVDKYNKNIKAYAKKVYKYTFFSYEDYITQLHIDLCSCNFSNEEEFSKCLTEVSNKYTKEWHNYFITQGGDSVNYVKDNDVEYTPLTRSQIYSRKNWRENKEILKERTKKWREENKEHVQEYRKNWDKEHREYLRKYYLNKYHTDEDYRKRRLESKRKAYKTMTQTEEGKEKFRERERKRYQKYKEIVYNIYLAEQFIISQRRIIELMKESGASKKDCKEIQREIYNKYKEIKDKYNFELDMAYLNPDVEPKIKVQKKNSRTKILISQDVPGLNVLNGRGYRYAYNREELYSKKYDRKINKKEEN